MTLLAVLDIETTGLSPDDDKMLEIAWAITDTDFNILSNVRTHLIEHAPEDWAEVWSQLRTNDFVRNMHQESGLLNDLRAKVTWPMSAIALQFRDDVEKASDGLDPEMLPLHLCGLSIGFDREFLKRDDTWSLFFDNDVFGFGIHHRLLDLSSVKLMLDSAGVPWERAENQGAHRAVNDVMEVVQQGRIFRRTLNSIALEGTN